MSRTAQPGPAYYYRLDAVRESYRCLREALPEPSDLLYSLKANPHPVLVATLARLGAHAEVSSQGELAAACEAGMAPTRMLYTGPGKSDAEVRAAVKAGVRWFSVDSPTGLQQVDAVARSHAAPLRCLLRLNNSQVIVGQGLAMTGGPSQFGADVDWVCADPGAFSAPDAGAGGGASVVGFHLYLGSNLDSTPALMRQFEVAVGSCQRAAEALGCQPEVIDLGGGFGAPYAVPGDLPRFTGLRQHLARLLDGAFPGWRERRPGVWFESGRYLVGTCGELVTRVADVKESYGSPVAVLESGINHLGGMAGLRRLPPLTPHLLAAASGSPVTGAGGDAALAGAIVAGPLCTPLDRWHGSATLPRLAPGDLVRVPNVGAYGLSASLLAFLGHPAPEEIVLDGDRVVDRSRLVLSRRSAPAATSPPGATA